MGPRDRLGRSQERPVGDLSSDDVNPTNYMGEFCTSRNTASLD